MVRHNFHEGPLEPGWDDHRLMAWAVAAHNRVAQGLGQYRAAPGVDDEALVSALNADIGVALLHFYNSFLGFHIFDATLMLPISLNLQLFSWLAWQCCKSSSLA
jgi:hypothetical protein